LNSKKIATNKNEMYEKVFEKRGVKKIVQFSTPVFTNPSDDELERIPTIEYYWKSGDKFWRLSTQYLGEPSLWWLIAKLNNKPSEALLNDGDVIKIPTNAAIAIEVLS
jgi:nucleoid-associated protein YgaU